MLRSKLLFVLFSIAFTASAQGYAFLTFEDHSGHKLSVSTRNLQLKFNAKKLYFGQKTIETDFVNKLYFTNEDQTVGQLTTVENIKKAIDENPQAKIYNLQGKAVDKSQLARGVYLVQRSNGTYKLMMK